MRNLAKIRPFDAAKAKWPLFAVVLGSSGAGKSFLGGTLPGRTLVIHFLSESHAPSSVAAGANTIGVKNIITPYMVDLPDMTADEAIEELVAQLQSPELPNQFDNIVMDGLPGLEELVMRSEAAKQAGISKTGRVDGFAKDRYVSEKLTEVVRLLTILRTKGVNVVVTSLARVSESETGDATVTPRLRGFGTLENLLPAFATILLTVRNNIDGTHFLDFNARFFRQKTDLTGKVTAVASFSTRIEGLSIDQTPPTVSSDLRKILSLQNKEVKFSRDAEIAEAVEG